MNEKEVLIEANRLVSEGLRKAAIDILVEYLESDSTSFAVHRALGRVYMLNRQPIKAVIHLKKSLELQQAAKTAHQPPSEYKADEFGDDDMDFIDTQSEQQSEVAYELGAEKQSASGKKTGEPASSGSRPTLTIDSPRPERTQVEKELDGVQIIYRGGKKQFPPSEDGPGAENQEPGLAEEEQQDIAPSTGSSHPDQASEQTDVLLHPEPIQIHDEEQFLPTEPQSRGPFTPVVLDQIDEADDEELEHEFSDEVEIVPVADELFEDDSEEDDDEDYLDELLVQEDATKAEKPVELTWDDFDDLDEFEEDAQRDLEEEELTTTGTVSREDRAKQMAIGVLIQSNWDTEHLLLLQQVFLESSLSGAARMAIEKEIAKGMFPEELALARKIRLLWFENQQFWISFKGIKRNVMGMQADAAYKQMSWLDALRIVRCFPSLPDIEEIYLFINDAFDTWYCSNNLRTRYKAFFLFLKYRIGSYRGALPGELEWSFIDFNDLQYGLDGLDLSHSNTPVAHQLLDYGLEIQNWPNPPENKMKVVKREQVSSTNTGFGVGASVNQNKTATK